MFSHVIRSDTVEIEAPIELVWDVLTDVARYREWNPFTTCGDSGLKVGLPVHLDVKLGLYRRKQTEWVRDLEPPNLLSWGMHMGAPFLLDSLREQRLTALSETRCTYHSTDALEGWLTPLAVISFGAIVRRGFNDVGNALKQRAEARYAELGT